jgi:hypothetical protein
MSLTLRFYGYEQGVRLGLRVLDRLVHRLEVHVERLDAREVLDVLVVQRGGHLAPELALF